MTETATPTKPKKPGVYVCKGCGIGEAVDADALANVAKSEFRIQTTATQDACCSDEGVAAIKADVDAGTVDGVVVAACSHRVMADRFRFNGTPVVRANLREHVAWSQPPGEEDTEMLAADQVRMAITQVQLTLPPLPSQVQEYSRTLLVLGGGITGMTAAREAVKAGHPVILVEKTDQLGGWANKWAGRMPYRPPYRDVQDSGIAKLVEAVKADKDIDVKLDTRVVKTAGQPGAFTVTLSHGGQESVVNVGAVVVATGFRPYDATKLGHLGYGASPDIVTGVELEAMLKAGGELKRKSDGKPVKHIAFVQCAGSRDPDHLPYCSSVCCGVSIKQALQITKADAKASAYIVYEELRTPGTAEEFYRQAQEAGVIFMKGKATKVDAGAMQVSYTDELLGTEVPLAGLDMIVLATGMVPNSTDPDVPVVEPEKSEAQLKGDINPFSAIPVAGYKPGGAEGPTPPAMPHLDRIDGVGLDSSEMGHPPSKFARVFARAGELGLKRVAHAGEEGPPDYVYEALDLLKVDRLDHGNRSLEDTALVDRLVAKKMTLTVCPLSNLRLCGIERLEDHPMKRMLDLGLRATCNSDDPAYFGGYVNDNYVRTAEAVGLTADDVIELARNSFRGSFLEPAEIERRLKEIDAAVAG